MPQLAYNPGYWDKKITGYRTENWSTKPSPFAQTVEEYIKPKGDLLELGSGAGQCGIWFAQRGQKVVISDGTDSNFTDIRKRLTNEKIQASLKVFDITQPFPFNDNSFDTVYAQLVLHYFDTPTTQKIIAEILRVLRPSGVLAVMVNSQKDEEYDPDVAEDGLMVIGKISKRFFTVDSLRPFVESFEPLLFDEEGRTPKDDAVSNSGMVRFVGRKK